MTRALLITPDVRAAIKAAIAHAAKHPILIETVKRLAQGIPQDSDVKLSDRPADFKRPESEHVLIPIGYHAAISFEFQPAGLCKHLSISVDTPGKLPSVESAKAIAEEFGISEATTGGAHIFIEEYEPGCQAVNIIALIGAPGTKTRQ